MPEIVTLSAGWLTPKGASPMRGERTQLLPAGVLWDAVRTPISLGLPVLHRLKASPADAAQLGPVLRDHADGRLYWLIQPGTTGGWPEGVRVLTTGSWLVTPRSVFDQTCRVRWAHLPDQRIISGAAWLAAALTDRTQTAA